MLDPVSTIAASAIVNLAFQKFVEAGAGKLAERFTEAAIAKMEALRQRIVAQLRGKSGKLDEALVRVEQGDREALATIAKNLDVAMEEQPAFAEEVRALAQEIKLMQIEDSSSMNQLNYGSTNYQVKTGPENTNFFGGEHHHH